MWCSVNLVRSDFTRACHVARTCRVGRLDGWLEGRSLGIKTGFDIGAVITTVHLACDDSLPSHHIVKSDMIERDQKPQVQPVCAPCVRTQLCSMRP
jgi:hypothetical protein